MNAAEEIEKVFRSCLKGMADDIIKHLLEGEQAVPEIDKKDIAWANVVQATKKAMKRANIGEYRLAITAMDATLTVAIGAEWRKRRFYQGDSFAWRDVRQRRNGGMLFVMTDHQFKEHSGRDRAGGSMGPEVFSAIEAEYPQMCKTFGNFADVFHAIIGVGYDELLASWTRKGESYAEMPPAPVVAPSERHVLIPDWGTW